MLTMIGVFSAAVPQPHGFQLGHYPIHRLFAGPSTSLKNITVTKTKSISSSSLKNITEGPVRFVFVNSYWTDNIPPGAVDAGLSSERTVRQPLPAVKRQEVGPEKDFNTGCSINV